MIRVSRLPFLVMAIACLAAGIWTGLARMGWNLTTLSFSVHHGAIMVGGFLVTLISLEKIIPLRKKVLFVLPSLSAASVAFGCSCAS